MLSRRRILGTLALAAASPSLLAAAPPAMRVWKSPTCGCCAAWVSYLEEHGFTVHVESLQDLSAVKRRYGVTPQIASCHTARIGGYTIEGHVPVADILSLLRTRPDVLGLTAPGMPLDSPGMRSREPRGYDVLAFHEDGRTAVYSRY